MFSLIQRLNYVSGLFSSFMLSLMLLTAVSTFFLQGRVKDVSFEVASAKVIKTRSTEIHSGRAHEMARVNYELSLDTTPIWNWNTKQVFVYVYADYKTDRHPRNRKIIWDYLMSKSNGRRKINMLNGRQKYEFREATDRFRNISANFTLEIVVQPFVGAVTTHQLAKAGPVTINLDAK